MTSSDTNQNLQFIIDRYDHYMESVQSKGNLYIVLNTFIIGGFITLVTTSSTNWPTSLHIISGVIILLGISSIIVTLLALTPFLKSTNSNSLIYFNSVSKMKYNNYHRMITTIDEKDYIKDMTCQIYSLAHGLSKKYKYLSVVGILLIIEFSCVFLWILFYFLTT